MRSHWDLWRGVSYGAAVRFFFLFSGLTAVLLPSRFHFHLHSQNYNLARPATPMPICNPKGGDAHCSMISSGRPSNGGGVSRTRGAFSMLDRRASAGAEASSMALLRSRWAVLDTMWHVRNDLENSQFR